MFTILTEKWEKKISMKILSLLGSVKRLTEVIKHEFLVNYHTSGFSLVLPRSLGIVAEQKVGWNQIQLTLSKKCVGSLLEQGI